MCTTKSSKVAGKRTSLGAVPGMVSMFQRVPTAMWYRSICGSSGRITKAQKIKTTRSGVCCGSVGAGLEKSEMDGVVVGVRRVLTSRILWLA